MNEIIFQSSWSKSVRSVWTVFMVYIFGGHSGHSFRTLVFRDTFYMPLVALLKEMELCVVTSCT